MKTKFLVPFVAMFGVVCLTSNASGILKNSANDDAKECFSKSCTCNEATVQNAGQEFSLPDPAIEAEPGLIERIHSSHDGKHGLGPDPSPFQIDSAAVWEWLISRILGMAIDLHPDGWRPAGWFGDRDHPIFIWPWGDDGAQAEMPRLPETESVPEPSTLLLLGVGMMSVGLIVRRRIR